MEKPMKLDDVCVGDVLTVQNRHGTQKLIVTRVNKNYAICGNNQFNRKTGNQKQSRRGYTNLFSWYVVAITKNGETQ